MVVGCVVVGCVVVGCVVVGCVVSGWVVGAAATTFFASLVMKRVGRRAGFTLGAAVGIVGALICAAALAASNFWLFCLGTTVFGVYNAFGQYYRFAAADVVLADPAGAVQTNVARLRRLLPVGIRLVTTPEGYCLAADRAAVDVTAFADHIAAAAGAVELDVRRDRLAAALGLWRGMPFPELDHPAIAPEVARLVDAGALRSTVTTRLSPIDAATLAEAHRRVESSATIGKVVVEAG